MLDQIDNGNRKIEINLVYLVVSSVR